jgi:hypothetical protein
MDIQVDVDLSLVSGLEDGVVKSRFPPPCFIMD